MGIRTGQKLKMLYIADILKKYSDEDHPINATEICDKLASFGVTAERKAVYDDIEQLTTYGYDIIKTRMPRNGFFMASRELELPEIFLLCDAVKAANFISSKKSRELINKLEGMLSIYETSVSGKVYFDSDGKTKNEELFYSVDTLNRAIKERKKIQCKYMVRELSVGKEIGFKIRNMKISPYALTWQDDHYYLIGNYEKYDNLIHMRIDRMKTVEMLDESRRDFSEVCEYKDTFDVADYVKRLFGMYGGKSDLITLKCSKKIFESMLDKFSENVSITNVTDDSFCITASAIVSEALVTFIMNYGSQIKVVEPEYLKKMVTDKAQEVLSVYSD